MTFPEPYSTPVDCLYDIPEEQPPVNEEEDRDLYPVEEEGE